MRSYINLLPFEHRRRVFLRSRLLQWSIVWVVCAITAVGVWRLKQNRYRNTLQATAAAEREYAPLAKLALERDEARSELGRLQAKGAILGQLRQERAVLTLMATVGRGARECDGRLVVRSLAFLRRETQAKKDGRKEKKPQKKKETAAEKDLPWATVSFKGNALDNLAIATFAASLRDSGLFRRVELKSSVGAKRAHEGVRSFLVECDI